MPEPSLDDLKSRLASDGAHTLGAEQTCAALDSSARGLGAVEAAARLARFGRNELPRALPVGVLRVFLRQFLAPLVYILLAAAAFSAVMRQWSDAGFILGVLVVNALIGSVQEYGAERSAEALRALAVLKAYVIRDGEDHEVQGEELVPGDIVLLEAGSKVPADVRLLSTAGLEIDESLLTGESNAATKASAPILSSDTPVADRVNQAFAGTLVTRGRAHGVVVATGPRTELGRIASSLASADTAKPPLLVRMDRFTKRIALGVGATAVALGAVSVARGGAVGEVFTLAIALAVSAIPEGLPVAITVALAIGARRMGHRKVIARRMIAVEALGSCTFIASDKTGTLTLNEQSVRRLLLPGEEPCDVTGQGVAPEGDVTAPPEARPLVRRLGEAAALCNDGFLGLRDEVWVHHGDAVDVALLAMAARAGVHVATLEASCPRVAAIPFDPEHRFAATLHRKADTLHAVAKGAGERILAMCSRMATRGGDVALDAAALEAQADALALGGFRVLALAAGPIELDPAAADFGHEHLVGLVFLGFVGMMDPLRPEARASVAACRRAGIEVAMVTGDHPATALAIARELGLAERPAEVVTGSSLAKITARGVEAVDELVRTSRVFARVEPRQKLEIVQSLIRLGHFVAVTGDGANDAPAMRAAHIGVAMGKRGTDVARESAELILTDDNFASIVAGVEEGRVAYANVRKVIFLLVSTGAAEVLLFVLTTATGLPAPLWPVQLLWLNLVTNGIQDVALAFEPAEGGELGRPPRPPREPVFDRLMLERTLVSALFMALVAFFAYRWMLAEGWHLATAQNGVLLLLVLFENVQAGNSRSETASLVGLSPLRNRLLLVGTVVAQLVHIGALYAPGLRDILHLEPVPLVQWLATLGLALGLLVVAELHKVLIRRRTGTPWKKREAPRPEG
ncbi:MAG: HAD-IC family P-type ATPase [Myxococcales bacterium]|nr:HAD-IC family P-type ATPase [Myxococcales bacterium]